MGLLLHYDDAVPMLLSPNEADSFSDVVIMAILFRLQGLNSEDAYEWLIDEFSGLFEMSDDGFSEALYEVLESVYVNLYLINCDGSRNYSFTLPPIEDEDMDYMIDCKVIDETTIIIEFIDGI